MPVPDFSPGEVLTAAAMDSIGLWLIAGGTQTGSTALNVDSVFTSNYTNYRLLITQAEVATANQAFRLNFRSGGVTNTTAGYNYAYRGLRANNTAADTALVAGTFAEIGIYIATFANLAIGSASIDIMSPQVSGRTFGLANAIGYEALEFQMRNGGFVFNDNTVFDGFRISLSGAGNVAFRWQLFGYRRS